MTSREKILEAVKNNQPSLHPLPDLDTIGAIRFEKPIEQFCEVLTGIGGQILEGYDAGGLIDYVETNFTEGRRYLTNIPALSQLATAASNIDAHTLEDVEVFVMKADFGVAENGAVWVTDASLAQRVLPFICQHLVVVLNPENMVNNMHEAYSRIGSDAYQFGLFLAGPSKTADIEQSLVLGAHGPKTMTLFFSSNL